MMLLAHKPDDDSSLSYQSNHTSQGTLEDAPLKHDSTPSPTQPLIVATAEPPHDLSNPWRHTTFK